MNAAAPGYDPAVTSTAAGPAVSRLVRVLAAVPGGAVGGVVGAGFGLAARVRRDKPLHAAGTVGAACLEVTSPAPSLGVPLFATRGRHDCLVRWSRSAGLPSPLPDVEGFALRVPDAGAGRTADLLFAASGTGRLTRHVMLPRRPRRHGPMSTLVPVAGANGALLFLVEPLEEGEPPTRWRFGVAEGGADWRALGTVTVRWGPDQPVRFDPVLHLLPGTGQYPLVRVLREPAYRRARVGADARAS